MQKILIGAIALALTGCPVTQQATQQSPSESPQRDLNGSAQWLDAYYQQNPPGGGWEYQSIAINGGSIKALFQIPVDRASQFEQGTTAQKITALRAALCPGSQEQIWQQIKGSDLKVFLMSGDRLVFNTFCDPHG